MFNFIMLLVTTSLLILLQIMMKENKQHSVVKSINKGKINYRNKI